MPKRSAVDAECGEDQEAADAALAASLQEAFNEAARPRRRNSAAVNPALPFAVPELRRVGPRSHTHRFAQGKKGVARSAGPGDARAAGQHTGAPEPHPELGDTPGAEGGALAPGGADGWVGAAGRTAPLPPRVERPPRRAEYAKGCLVWARLPGVPCRWPGRMCVPVCGWGTDM